MNNQILNIKESGNTIILLKKYQNQNKWGMKMVLNIEEKYKDYIINISNDEMVSYQLHPDQENKHIDFEIDVNTDTQKLMKIFKALCFNLFGLSSNTIFTCNFMKRSSLFI